MTDADLRAAGFARLREEFPAEHVGLLPRATCGDCSKRSCQRHQKAKCQACGNYITTAHIHLDYVGHGAVTDRLLEVDPGWNWEPLAFDAGGMPAFVYDDRGNPVALWIRLTVLGVTRLGVGTCPSNQADAEKVLIGDALRNAAMRFGVALDLWIKGQAEDSEQRSATATRSESRRPGSRGGGPAPEDTVPAAPKAKIDQIVAALDVLDAETTERLQGFVAQHGLPTPRQLTEPQADKVLAWLAKNGAPAPAEPGPDAGEGEAPAASPSPGDHEAVNQAFSDAMDARQPRLVQDGAA